MNDFSESWGINGIPTVFLIDAEGKPYSTEARGRLDALIPRLLKQARSFFQADKWSIGKRRFLPLPPLGRQFRPAKESGPRRRQQPGF
jgi:hypothetical protein